MKWFRVGVMTWCCGLVLAVSLTAAQQPAPDSSHLPAIEGVQAYWEFLHTASEAIYDQGKGTWGHEKFGYRMPMRDTAWRVDAYLNLYAAGAKGKELYKQRALEGLAYLLKVQRPNGLFPFPFNEASQEHQRRQQANPRAVEDGWLVEPGPDSGLVYDNGLTGCTMLKAYAVLKDEKYLNAARRAADWAMAQPLAKNVNYNSFTIRLLTELYRVSPKENYLQDAVRRTKESVLPTQTKSGQWADSHNARLVYHGIITRQLISLYSVLPPRDPFSAELKAALDRALENLVDRCIRRDGLSGVGGGSPGTCMYALLDLMKVRALSEREKQALHACIDIDVESLSELRQRWGTGWRNGNPLNDLLNLKFGMGSYLAYRLSPLEKTRRN